MRSQSVFPLLPSPTANPRRGRLNAHIAPRLAPAALRVPNPVHAPQLALTFPQSQPQIFVHEGARQTLERRLRAAFFGPVLLAVPTTGTAWSRTCVAGASCGHAST